MIKEFLNLFKVYTIKTDKQYDYDIKTSDLYVVKPLNFENKKESTNANVVSLGRHNFAFLYPSEEQQEDLVNFVWDVQPVTSVYFYRPIDKIIYNFIQKLKIIIGNIWFLKWYNRKKYYQKYVNYSNVEKLGMGRFLLSIDCIKEIIEKDIINAFRVA